MRLDRVKAQKLDETAMKEIEGEIAQARAEQRARDRIAKTRKRTTTKNPR